MADDGERRLAQQSSGQCCFEGLLTVHACHIYLHWDDGYSIHIGQRRYINGVYKYIFHCIPCMECLG